MKRDYLFYMSCFFLIVSIILFQINTLLTGLGILVFIIGMITLIFSRKRVVKKVLTIVLFLVIGSICLISGFILQGHYANDNFYVSNNIKGKVRIIFSRNCGITPYKDKNWNDIYVKGNILVVKRKLESILYRSKYFLVDSDGNKIILKRLSSIKDFDGQPSVIEYNPMYWKENKTNIHEFLIIKDTLSIKENDNNLDSISRLLLLDCDKE